MGLCVSVVVQRMSSMAKLLSGCAAMAVSLVMSSVLFDTLITPKVIMSIAAVSAGIVGYNMPTSPGKWHSSQETVS